MGGPSARQRRPRLGAEADDRAIQADALSDLVSQDVYIGRPRTGLDLAHHGLELAEHEFSQIVPDDREQEPWLYYFDETHLYDTTAGT